jgi:TonB-dependent receptor
VHTRKSPCLLLTFLILVSAAIASFGQGGAGAITGTVQDSSGKVLVGAKVVIDPSGRRAATDDQGQFRIPNVPAGQYALSASYVGFATFSANVAVKAGETASVTAALSLGQTGDSVLVTAPRLQGEAEAVNVERMSDQIVQVAPMGVITSLPNTNIADAIGRLPSVSLERDEGEGKYVQIRGTEPRLSNLTINGVNVPSVEVTVRNVKMDAIPSNGIERIEVYKTLSSNMDADGVGGTVNLVTPTAQDKPTYSLNGTAGYNPLQNGFWRGGFDGTFGQRWGTDKKYGFLLGGSWDRTNRGIDDLEPGVTTGVNPANGQNIAYFNGEDFRSYDYYRTRYGFTSGIDVKVLPTMSVYFKGLFADFHDFGDTHVYTPNTGSIHSVNGSQIVFDDQNTCPPAAQQAGTCSVGFWQYRHYIRRPDQQVFSFLTGARHDLSKDVIIYDFAVSRGHNIGGQDFPTTRFGGLGYQNSGSPGQIPGATGVGFAENISNPYRPHIYATDGTNGFDAAQYSVYQSASGSYHATQLNIQGSASLAHSLTIDGHPDTFSLGLKIRNSYSTQRENDTTLNGNNFPGPFGMAQAVGTYTNPTYYNKSFAINGMAYGPTTSYSKIQQLVASNNSGFTEDIAGDSGTWYSAFFNADERITSGYIQDVIFVGPVRLEGGVRFDNGGTHFLAYTTDATITNAPCFKDPSQNICNAVTPNRADASYFNALPSAALQWQFQKDSNLRAVYSRGVARPNISDLVPAISKDGNQTPYPTVSTGNPKLVPTKSDNVDILVEHFFKQLGILQAGYFYKHLNDPIYPTANVAYYDGTNFCTQGSSPSCRQWQIAQSINGPNAHIQGIEAQWEQRFSFLPSVLSGFGVNANYSHTVSQVTFPDGFDGGRTDHPSLDRTSPNDYNFNLTYDKNRFSGRFAISHNDQNIASYGWNATTGPASDPILGLKGPLGDNYFYPHTQFDAQASYHLYKGVQFVFSALNMSNEVFGFYNGSKIYPVQREYYRPTFSFGLRWNTASREQ